MNILLKFTIIECTFDILCVYSLILNLLNLWCEHATISHRFVWQHNAPDKVGGSRCAILNSDQELIDGIPIDQLIYTRIQTM